MKKILALALAALMVATCVVSFASCGKKDDWKRIEKKGKFICGITIYAPMNYYDANGDLKQDDTGTLVGFDTELAKLVAEKLGVEVEFVVLADWGKKFMDLQAGTIDCVWNGMTITDEARKNASVSDVYLKNSQVVVLPADKAAAVKSAEDLKDFTFAVEEGSAGQSIAEETGLKTVAVKDMAMALVETKSGACDGCIIDKTMADATVGEGASYANLAVAMTLSTEEFGVAFRPESDLTAEFNAFLKDYQESGKFAALAEKYEVAIEN